MNQYYMSQNKHDCLYCPAKCIHCYGTSHDEAVCDTCRDPADMLPPHCDCKPGYISNLIGDDCLLCPPSCKKCTPTVTEAACTECNDPLMDYKTHCSCPPHFTVSMDYKKCEKCSEDESCLECTDLHGHL